ncbi:MAG TPA: glycogen/starch synthase [Salinivirgaceae bacterium]|nr:glycogen/starch synthase [Salinivirgaceae bacterium]HQA76112.1 glycogen/starch synthase [Salinivirgaceae bacterium]
MKKKGNSRILYVAQEIFPYLPESSIANTCRYLPQGIQERGKEIRTFMPKYGCINERRNQLHEVIRLSGMNLVINDTDHPLIIKVASIQSARMQVYFIDNEDYFQRKAALVDDNGKFFADNDERTILFANGVLETVKKLRWSPDIVHCHGWLSAIVTLYIKYVYNRNPLYEHSKTILTLYDETFSPSLNKEFFKKLTRENIPASAIKLLEKDPSYVNLMKTALDATDGIIIGDKNINPEVLEYAKKSKKPILEYQDGEEYVDLHNEFYNQL